MMQNFQLTTKLLPGKGYGYILFPRSELDAEDTVRVLITINGQEDTRDAVALDSGNYMISFNREQVAVFGIDYGKDLNVKIERIDAPPQLNDLPEDFLTALKSNHAEENFKRLPPERQIEALKEVQSAETPEGRASQILKIASFLRENDAEMPRGESL